MTTFILTTTIIIHQLTTPPRGHMTKYFCRQITDNNKWRETTIVVGRGWRVGCILVIGRWAGENRGDTSFLSSPQVDSFAAFTKN